MLLLQQTFGSRNSSTFPIMWSSSVEGLLGWESKLVQRTIRPRTDIRSRMAAQGFVQNGAKVYIASRKEAELKAVCDRSLSGPFC